MSWSSASRGALERSAAGMLDSWRDDAACAGRAHIMDPPRGGRDRNARRAALALCRTCPVLRACRAWAIDLPAEVSPGWIVAGLDEEQRALIRVGLGEVPDGYKRCQVCDEIKPLTEFHVQPAGRGGRRAVCKLCRCTERRREYHEARRSR